ncbi:CocE/NonD family hydrolase [Pinirhizobacter sp.]|jgi:hypothetical protein|uniref:CocE/NonD family hydrolase n=1 Tax=Pinirhizobacter sp. TaxID=2950432 RepID=UPI002F41ACC8
MPCTSRFSWRLAALIAFALSSAAAAQEATAPQYPNYPSETPATFTQSSEGFDYERRQVMIPMRDGVKLHTVILVPKGAHRAGILLTRTPYDADELTTHGHTGNLGATLNGYDNAPDVIVQDGYIRVVQDIRGKYGSEGDYVMNRPLHGPQNPTPVDEATDTYDTIDWLVKNIPESNGRVGTIGISYDGFEPLMSLVNPHPALKVAVPMNPMVDGWMGDDWFHNGAFRAQNLPYILEQAASRKNEIKFNSSVHDEYDLYLRAGATGEMARRYGLEQVGFWRKLIAHPAYDSFWSDQAVDKVLAGQPLKVPTMLVHSLWDQEDIYGAIAVYKAIKPKDTGNDKVFLVMGPWHHGQEIENASSLGAVQFGSDTGLYFRQKILRPFLAHYLKDDAPANPVAPVTAYETGSNVWRTFRQWPVTTQARALYLGGDGKLGFAKPSGEAYQEYVSDPAKPVPFRARPIQPVGYDPGQTWSEWLVDDQREASGRPDVVSWTSDVLTQPLVIRGQPVVHLRASTTGTDSDWVVKLIDVYPDMEPMDAAMGGYQLMIAGDILRGRYREGFTVAKPIQAGAPLDYSFPLPTADHVFLPGHRLMVQVQSSWFPLYDRNPQTYVDNIFFARPGDYKKATQRIFSDSHLDLPVAGN